MGQTRLPAILTQEAGLKEVDVLEAEIAGDGTVLLSPEHHFDKRAFLADLDKLHHALPRTETAVEQLRRQARYRYTSTRASSLLC